MDLVIKKEEKHVIQLCKDLRSYQKNQAVYEVQVQTTARAQHRLLQDNVDVKTTQIYRLSRNLESNHIFIRKNVTKHLVKDWVAVDFRLERLTQILERDWVQITADESTKSVLIASTFSGEMKISRSGQTVKISRKGSKDESLDLFDCIDVRFPRGLEFQHEYIDSL